MKLLYKKAKWKNNSSTVSIKNEKKSLSSKRRNKKSTNGSKRKPISYNKLSYLGRDSNRVIIDAPKVFSLINNPIETLDFFSKFRMNVKNRKWTYFNLSNIEELTADAVVYMVSRFKFYDKKYKYFYYSGNWPKNKRCHDFIKSSGFSSYIKTELNKPHTKLKTLEIREGKNVDGRIAKDVLNFAAKCLNLNNNDKIRQVYETIIECMTNTKHHAYKDKNKYTRWWLMAFHDEENNKVNFTFVDNGYGIPSTLKKNFRDRIAKVVPAARVKDHHLIESALRGDFRTRTGLANRGRGLPKIETHYQSRAIDDLFIISNNAYINKSKNNSFDMDRKFTGTLLSWNFV